ncbi:MAG: hypothetical protein AUI91_07160 [Acidobacteria bacterium 13_1_40CM_3_56_11]|nr:MAG: hypothetical protein AUI91_07160 [Acidobacteria bacterium 13_1_40CM_3_56_11]
MEHPFCISRSSPEQSTRLTRLPFEHDIGEDWLQNVLDAAPDILPISVIDDRVQGGLVSLGREIGTPAGSIDNLFLSTDGYLVVVDTKLWRNPDARRSVIAQILDYAAHVRQWDYTQIEKLWKKRHNGVSLWAGIAPEDPEQDWVDRVTRNLSEGRMALLIVGDGIRSRSRELAEIVSGRPDFPFRLALAEMRMYSLDSERLIVVPDVLLKTVEVERAIVRVTFSGAVQPAVQVEVPKEPRKPGKATLSLSAEAFMRELSAKGPDGVIAAETVETLLQVIDQANLQIDWGTGGFMIRTPDPVRPGALLSLATVSRLGAIVYGYGPTLRSQLERSVPSPEIAAKAVDALFEFFRKFGGRVSSGAGLQINISIPTLRGREEQFVGELVKLRDFIARLMIEAEPERNRKDDPDGSEE